MMNPIFTFDVIPVRTTAEVILKHKNGLMDLKDSYSLGIQERHHWHTNVDRLCEEANTLELLTISACT